MTKPISPSKMEQNRRESYAGPLEVAAMFGDDFLAKRFAAEKEEGVG